MASNSTSCYRWARLSAVVDAIWCSLLVVMSNAKIERHIQERSKARIGEKAVDANGVISYLCCLDER